MWYIFPQIDRLGHSTTSRHYAIKSIVEVRQYLNHPVLGTRPLECAEAVFANELPRRKQRGITKNLDYGRRKRRGIRPVEAVPKALLESLLFFTINFNWAFGTAPIEGPSISQIFGYPDDLKLKSSMTLFACVAELRSVFVRILYKYFIGERDVRTLQLLEKFNVKNGRCFKVRCFILKGLDFYQ
jgi:uncharacterized protein (DUF1810 family)